MHIRDPIHGAIELTADERALIDSPQYQRLRNVKQLGFADLAFPGATHTRYAHGLGAMAMATKVFDAFAPQLEMERDDRARLRQTLRQVVSGELDADRMDYLQRDSFFTGVNYGKFDADWIVQNLAAVERDGRVYLALLHRAVFAFEDFLLSRYHMFLSVYFHSTSVGYEVLLQRWCESGEYSLPADPDEYLLHDDIALLSALRASQNPWARRIVRRQGYRVLMEIAPGEDARALSRMEDELEAAGVDGFVTVSRGVLSHYGKEATLWVKSPRGEVPIGEYTPLYERYAEAATLARWRPRMRRSTSPTRTRIRGSTRTSTSRRVTRRGPSSACRCARWRARSSASCRR